MATSSDYRSATRSDWRERRRNPDKVLKGEKVQAKYPVDLKLLLSSSFNQVV